MPTMNGWRVDDQHVRCPFYRAHAKTAVKCEGPIPGTAVTVEFRRKSAKDKQYTVFCCGRFEYCEMYRAAAREYEDD